MIRRVLRRIPRFVILCAGLRFRKIGNITLGVLLAGSIVQRRITCVAVGIIVGRGIGIFVAAVRLVAIGIVVRGIITALARATIRTLTGLAIGGILLAALLVRVIFARLRGRARSVLIVALVRVIALFGAISLVGVVGALGLDQVPKPMAIAHEQRLRFVKQLRQAQLIARKRRHGIDVAQTFDQTVNLCGRQRVNRTAQLLQKRVALRVVGTRETRAAHFHGYGLDADVTCV